MRTQENTGDHKRNMRTEDTGGNMKTQKNIRGHRRTQMNTLGLCFREVGMCYKEVGQC